MVGICSPCAMLSLPLEFEPCHIDSKTSGFLSKDTTTITIESMLEGDSRRPSVLKANNVPGGYSIYPRNSAAQVWTLHYVNAPKSHVVVYEGDSQFRVTIDDMDIHDSEPAQFRCSVPNGECPFICEIPNYWLIHDQIQQGREYALAVSAFANTVAFYPDKDEFDDSPRNRAMREECGSGYAENFFGLLGDFATTRSERPAARINAEVKRVKLPENPVTHIQFYALTLDTLIGDLGMVCPVDILDPKPFPGGIVEGSFYLSGKFLDLEERVAETEGS